MILSDEDKYIQVIGGLKYLTNEILKHQQQFLNFKQIYYKNNKEYAVRVERILFDPYILTQQNILARKEGREYMSAMLLLIKHIDTQMHEEFGYPPSDIVDEVWQYINKDC